MEYRERAMSLTSRPDERRREEARIARASQARPLAEPESIQVFQGDNTFSRVTVPKNQLDDVSKSVMAILGPYHSVLGGPAVHGPRTSRVSETSSTGVRNGMEKASTVERASAVGVDVESDSLSSTSSGPQQPHLHPRQSNNSARPVGSSSAGGDAKRPLSLSLSQHAPASSSSSSTTPSKPGKPTISTPSDTNNSSLSSSSSSLPSLSHHAVVTSSSSPLTLAQSPVKSVTSKETHIPSRESGGRKESRHMSCTPPALSSTVKPKISVTSRSPKKDAHHQQQVPPHVSVSSKSRSSATLPSSGKTDERSIPLPSSAPPTSLTLPVSKDHTSSSSNSIKTTNSSSPMLNTTVLSTSVTNSSAITSYTGKPSPIASSVTNSSAITSYTGKPSPIASSVTNSSAVTSYTSKPSPIASSVTNSSAITSYTGKPSPIASSVTNSSAITSYTSKPSPIVSSVSTSYISPSAQTRVDGSPHSRPRSSFTNRAHITPSPRPNSTTPTKTKPHLPNGITSQRPNLSTEMTVSATTESTLSSSAAHSKLASSTKSPSMASSAEKTEKTKSLTLWIPSEKKIPATKSDLIDILKEMAELQAPLTAIETPQKADGEFPFYMSGSPKSRPVVKLSHDLCFNDSVKKETKNTPKEEKTDISKGIKKEGVSQAEVKPLPALSSAPVLSSGDVTKEMKVEEKPAVELKEERDLNETFIDGSVRGQAAEVSRCSSSSSSISQSSRHRSIGKTMTDDNSILMRDLDLSEDSDVEPAYEENNSSECQSKKGKVIASSVGAAAMRSVSPMSSSSSSSSSSDSSSESGAEDDDDEDDEKKKRSQENYVEPKKSSERRLSSSSSSSSSSSLSDEDGNDEDGDEKNAEGKNNEDMDDIKTTIERGEKTPSPAGKQGVITPASLGTPSAIAQENSETSLSWRLDHFMQPRKNTSPASVSPLKSSSPTLHSAPPSVQQKDDSIAKTPDQSRPRTLREVGQCETMSFELQAQKVSVHDGDGSMPDEEGDHGNDSEVFKRKSSITIPSKKHSEASLVKPPAISKQSEHRKNILDLAANSSRKVVSKEAQLNPNATLDAQKFVGPPGKELLRKQSSFSTSSKKDRKETSPAANINPKTLKTPSLLTKAQPIRPGSCSSSNDEIDVVSYTPDEKLQHRLAPSPSKTANRRSILELSKKLFNEALSESSDEDIKASPSKGKSAENNHKHHKRKGKFGEIPSSVIASVPLLSNSIPVESSVASPSGPSSKTSKKDKDNAVAFDHLEAISKPPNLLSPLHSTYSSPSVASTKPLPPFHSSFSPLHSSTSVMPPYVTVTRNADGTSRPKLMIQIRNSCLSKKVMNWVKEKQERRRKTYRDVKSLECSKSEASLETRKESKSLSLADLKSSNTSSGSSHGGDTVGIPRNEETPALSQSALSTAHSITSQVSKAGKHKSRDSIVSGVDAASPLGKMPKHTKSSSKEAHSSTSSMSSSSLGLTPTILPAKSTSPIDTSTTTAHTAAAVSSQAKSASLTCSSPVVTPSKTSGAGAVTHFSFADDRDVHVDEHKLDKTKSFKRKPDIANDDSLSKRSKPDSVIDKSGSAASAPVSKRRDSANSTSSKGSHQSTSSKKLRRISANSKKDNSSNNNSIEKTNTHMINGSEKSSLPFNHYINGNNNSNGIVSSGAALSSSSSSSLVLPSNLPQPSPVETQLHSTKHYLARATEHKHHADNLKDKPAKYEPYLRSGLSFFLAGYSMELGKRELNTSYSMYNDTSNLLQYVIRMRANSSSNPESSDRERKLMVLIIRLQSYLNHRLYRLRRAEVSKLKKVIESEQTKYHSSSTTAVSTSSSTNANAAVTSTKPHAPSPHQTNWSKTNTDTPSPMSPTPSPAGSVSSQGSCELVPGKITNGTASSSSTPLTSPSPGTVSVHHRLHAVTQKYFILTSHMVKALELWDQADVESRGFEDFFTVLDNACGPLSFHSDPPVVVRYMKHALRLLSL